MHLFLAFPATLALGESGGGSSFSLKVGYRGFLHDAAKSYRWLKELETGSVPFIQALAARKTTDESYVAKMLLADIACT